MKTKVNYMSTQETTKFPFGRKDWWDLTQEQRLELFHKERESIIEKQGCFIQGVINIGAYTIGVSRNPETPYELIVGTDKLASVLEEIRLKQNLHEGFTTTTENFSVSIGGSKEDLRLGLLKIDNPELIFEFMTKFGKGIVKEYKEGMFLYYVVFGDTENQLPFEKPDFDKESFLRKVLKRLVH